MIIKVIMDSGIEYELEDIESVDNFQSKLKNDIGIVKNTFVYLDNDETIVINPSHISSIEVIE
ncbi:MAG: hypothetical protein LPK00_13185 [Bacillaceae bacterium]|nr:hypothetical protein [Bacillaceae bacterium]